MPAIRPGQVILGQFRVEEFIAAGGMGAVYRVWDTKRQTALAMKVLHIDPNDDEDLFKQLLREAKALRQLAHPNIVPFYGLYRTRGFAFLLEKFIDGATLKDLLSQKRQISPRNALIILKAVSAALAYAHNKGLVHCDVKPGNVMIERGGNVYLADFGIARHADSTTTTIAGAGTPAYMAPEQILGKTVVPATDVYSLGVMAYELLVGRRPFTGKEKFGNEPTTSTSKSERLRRAHLKLHPPDPRRFNPSLPESAAKVLLKALAKRPENRYQDAWEFFKALCAALGTSPERIPARLPIAPAPVEETAVQSSAFGTTLPPDTAGRKSHPPRESAKMPGWLLPTIGGAVVALAIFAIAVVALMGKHSTSTNVGSSIPTLAVAAQSNSGQSAPSTNQNRTQTQALPAQNTSSAAPPSKTMPTNTPIPPTPTPKPPPRPRGHVAFEVFAGRNNVDIYIMNADGSGTRPLLNSDANERYPSLSPDGRYLAYASDENGTYDIFVYDLQTGARRRLTTWDSLEWYPAWSPDGKYIVFSSNHRASGRDFDLYIISWSDGEMFSLTSGGGVDNLPDWSPRGDWIAFQRAWGGKWSIYLIRPNGNGLQRLVSGQAPAWSPNGRYIAFGGKTAGDHRDIFIYDTQTNHSTQLTHSRGDSRDPCWSADGGFLFFESNRSGRWAVYRMKADGSDVRKMTNLGRDAMTAACGP